MIPGSVRSSHSYRKMLHWFSAIEITRFLYSCISCTNSGKVFNSLGNELCLHFPINTAGTVVICRRVRREWGIQTIFRCEESEGFRGKIHAT
uniref:Integrase zinc-binding domain-containing protein n=1 Tax=Ascaris lumbricoides TaxID=6252 RepID=A0A9J2PNK4_ASCLU